MNRKIFKFIITVMSAVGTVYAVILPLTAKSFPGQGEGIQILAALALVAAILLLLHFSKRRFTNLYSMLHAMGENNKLHPLRELVMVQHARLTTEYNSLKIMCGEFFYRVSPTKDVPMGANGRPEAYDVHYRLTFQMKKPRFSRMTTDHRTLRFYLIGREMEFMKNLDAKLWIDGERHDIAAVFRNPTLRGKSGDHIASVSALYEVHMILPQTISRRSLVEVQISYDIIGNLLINAGQHVFFIVPQNYGKNMGRMKVYIDAPDQVIFSPELQQVHFDGEWETIEVLSGTKEEDRVHFQKTIKPNMDASYFIQYDLKDKFLTP